MKRWAACAIVAAVPFGTAAGAPQTDEAPAVVQAKLDAFLQCVTSHKGAPAAGGRYSLCGARFDKNALACLRQRTRIEAETVDPKQFPGRAMYSFAVYCPVPPSLVGIVIEKTRSGRWTIDVAMPAP